MFKLSMHLSRFTILFSIKSKQSFPLIPLNSVVILANQTWELTENSKSNVKKQTKKNRKSYIVKTKHPN